MTAVFRFYAKPLSIVLLINSILYFILGCYYEEYEGLLSTLVHGTYNLPCIRDWNTDTHFLSLCFYACINQYFPNIQIYGVLLFIYNELSLVLLGCLLYRVLSVNLKVNQLSWFLLFYAILSVDFSVNLGSTRIAFMLSVFVYAFIESLRFEGKQIANNRWYLLLAVLFFAVMMRSETVLLVSVSYVCILLIHKRFFSKVLIPIGMVLLVFLTYNYVVNHFMSESRRVFFDYEFDFIDRNNIDYENLSQLQRLNVLAFKEYLIADKEFFTVQFYKSIASVKYNWSIHSFKSTIGKSLFSFRLAAIFIFFFLFSCLWMFYSSYNKKWSWSWVLYVCFIFFLPLLLGLYVVVPVRFLISYYTIASLINLILSDWSRIRLYGFRSFICLLFLFLFFNSELDNKIEYLNIDKKVKTAAEQFQIQYKTQKSPVIVNTLEYKGRYFPVKPLDIFDKPNALFLNFWYFEAYNCYNDSWKKIGCDNPLSLNDKLNTIVKNNLTFISDRRSLDFLKIYVNKKYGRMLQEDELGVFDKDLIACKLKYIR